MSFSYMVFFGLVWFGVFVFCFFVFKQLTLSYLCYPYTQLWGHLLETAQPARDNCPSPSANAWGLMNPFPYCTRMLTGMVSYR